MRVTMEQMHKDVEDFRNRHNCKRITFEKDFENGGFVEDYCYADGAVLTVIVTYDYEFVKKIEYYSTDEPASKFVY